MSTQAFFLPAEPVDHEPVFLSRPVAAIQLLPPRENGGLRLGPLSRLPAGAVLYVCGDGFDERTTKVLVDGQHYFVFREEIGWPKAAKAAISHGLHRYTARFLT
jgi:hypothetical protein